MRWKATFGEQNLAFVVSLRVLGQETAPRYWADVSFLGCFIVISIATVIELFRSKN
jgi:hypothetical protein